MHYIHIIYTRDLLLDDFTVFNNIIIYNYKYKDNKSVFHVLNLYTENTVMS